MTQTQWAELRQVVDLYATDREHGVGLAGELCHTLIRFV